MPLIMPLGIPMTMRMTRVPRSVAMAMAVVQGLWIKTKPLVRRVEKGRGCSRDDQSAGNRMARCVTSVVRMCVSNADRAIIFRVIIFRGFHGKGKSGNRGMTGGR